GAGAAPPPGSCNTRPCPSIARRKLGYIASPQTGTAPAAKAGAVNSQTGDCLPVFRSGMGDLGAQDVEAFAHEGREAGPALGGHHVAVDISLSRLDVDVDAADGGDFRLAGAETGHLAALQHAWNRHQDLDTV